MNSISQQRATNEASWVLYTNRKTTLVCDEESIWIRDESFANHTTLNGGYWRKKSRKSLVVLRAFRKLSHEIHEWKKWIRRGEKRNEHTRSEMRFLKDFFFVNYLIWSNVLEDQVTFQLDFYSKIIFQSYKTHV